MLNYENVIIDGLFDCCLTSSEQYVSATCIFMTKTSIQTVHKVYIDGTKMGLLRDALIATRGDNEIEWIFCHKGR